MQPSNTFKKSFLKLMIKGLKLNGAHTKPMTIQERKRAIKNSADAAMVLARGRSTRWSAALITDLSKQEKKTSNSNAMGEDYQHGKWKIPTSKKILRRSLRSRRPGAKKTVEASVVARRMVKKRTQLLKRIIPGGESLDSLSLLGPCSLYTRAHMHTSRSYYIHNDLL